MSEYTDRLAELERLGSVDRELAWCVAQLRERDRKLAEARTALRSIGYCIPMEMCDVCQGFQSVARSELEHQASEPTSD